MESTLRVAVVTGGSPELLHLAEALSAQGMLVSYAHPLAISAASRSQGWARVVARVPRLGSIIERRVLSDRIPKDRIRCGAPCLEVLRAMVGTRSPVATHDLVKLRNRRMGRIANQLAQEVDVLVVSYTIARYVDPRKRTARLVLNMPTSHPQFQNDQFDLIEARRPSSRAMNLRNAADELAATRFELANADLVLCGSAFAGETISSESDGVPICVAPYGIDSDSFFPSIGMHDSSDDPVRFLCVANVTPSKGIPDLAQAFEGIPSSKASLTIVGRAPHGVEWLGDGSRHYVGRRSHQEVAELMRHSDVLVLPSWFEGLPLSVLEGLASGLPCIVTDRGAAEAVRDGVEGLVVPPGDPVALRAAVMQLAEEPELRQSMRDAAQRRAAEFTWNAYTDRAIEAIVDTAT